MERRALERLGHHIVSRRLALGFRNRTDLVDSLQFTVPWPTSSTVGRSGVARTGTARPTDRRTDRCPAYLPVDGGRQANSSSASRYRSKPTSGMIALF